MYLRNEDESLFWKPSDYLKSIWDTLPPSAILIVSLICGSDYIAFIQTYHTTVYGSALIFGYVGNFTYIFKKDGVWYDNKVV